MRRNARSITTSPEIVKHIDGLTEANFNLLTKLVPWLDANEKAQRKSRTAVLIRLAKIETMVTMIHGAQIAEAHLLKPHCDEKKIRKDAEDAEQYVSMHSESPGLKMVRYIYGQTEMPERRHDRRRKWWGWEI